MMAKITFRKRKISKMGQNYVIVVPKTYHADLKKLGLEYWEIRLKKL